MALAVDPSRAYCIMCWAYPSSSVPPLHSLTFYKHEEVTCCVVRQLYGGSG